LAKLWRGFHHANISFFLILKFVDSFPPALIELVTLIRGDESTGTNARICLTAQTVGEIWVNSHTHKHN
jgi:hypothetical protein